MCFLCILIAVLCTIYICATRQRKRKQNFQYQSNENDLVEFMGHSLIIIRLVVAAFLCLKTTLTLSFLKLNFYKI